jgi:GT2 family glycosyltransferase
MDCPPSFSVVVPTYRRAGELAGCLRALAALEYPRRCLEVVVVDDGGDAPLEPVIAPVRERLDVTLLRQANGGPASARNTGGMHARGELIAFTDDDCAPAPDWLAAFAARFGRDPDCMVGGRTINALTDNPYASASQLLNDYLYAHYNRDSEQAGFFAANNLALPATRFRAVGGFDTTFPLAAAEDREFCDRWRSAGHRMVYAPEAVVYHSHRLTPRGFLRQHFTYGRGAYAYHRRRAARGGGAMTGPARLEPWSFYGALLRYPGRRARGGEAPLLTALLAGTQVMNGAGFLWEGGKRLFHDIVHGGRRRGAETD